MSYFQLQPINDLSCRQVMLYTSLAIKSELRAPEQGWAKRILVRAGCPAKWQTYIIDLARKLQCKWNHEGLLGFKGDIEHGIDNLVAMELSIPGAVDSTVATTYELDDLDFRTEAWEGGRLRY